MKSLHEKRPAKKKIKLVKPTFATSRMLVANTLNKKTRHLDGLASWEAQKQIAPFLPVIYGA